MSFSRNSESLGGSWTNKLIYYPESSSETGPEYNYTSTNLHHLIALVDPNGEEVISDIRVCATPIEQSSGAGTGVFKHAYVVLKSKNWWWSIEKNSENITLQRDKSLEAVRDRYGLKKRIDLSEVQGYIIINAQRNARKTNGRGIYTFKQFMWACVIIFAIVFAK